MIELHFEEGRAHARGLARRFSACAAPKLAGHGKPAEQAEPEGAERDGEPDLRRATARNTATEQRSDAARRPYEHARACLRIGLGEAVERPQQQDEDDNAER